MEKVVYVIGSFDLFHRGHVELLRRARALGDRLIVAINGDDIVEKYKRRPYIKEDDRLAVVQACRYVDEAFVIHTFDNKEVNMVLILLFMGMIGVVCLIWNKFV